MYNEETKKEVYFCKRLRMLEWLSDRGFRPYGTMPDAFDQTRTIWLFKNTSQLQQAINEYREKRRLERESEENVIKEYYCR